MENSPNIKDKLYDRVFIYSKEYLPFKRFRRYVILFGYNILLGLVTYFSFDLVKTYPDKVPFYLFFLVAIVLSAFFGGFSSAFLTIGIFSLEAYLLFKDFYKAGLDITLYLQLVFFVGGAIIISYFIDLLKENSEIKKLKEREKTYASTFIQLHGEYIKALKNIKARDEFLSIVSHELKTPLSIMLLKLHGMLKSIQSVSLANFSIHELMNVLKNSEQQIKWLTVVINDLVDISLITTGRMNLQIEDTDLVGVTNQVKQSFSEVLKKEKYKIIIHAKSSVVGRWDKVRIEQAITNLVSNAIKYGNNKPIDIKISNSRGLGRFTIKDEGIGIAKDDQSMVFDLFKRASGLEENRKGLGVGLYITSQIVKMHSGKISVSSVPRQGTSFSFELPLNKK